MQMSDVKVLVAGCGSIGKRHMEVLSGLGVKNLAACDPSADSLADIKALAPGCALYEDYDRALAQFGPDAVFVLTPTKLHIPMAIKAVEADAHVFIEKPLSNTPQGVDALSALAQARGKTAMVGFCFRSHQALRKAKALLDSGAIGRLISIRALMGEPFYDIHPDYRNLYYAKYSGAFELVHDLDLAIWYAGQDIESAQGVYGSFSDMGMEAPDTVEMLVKFKDRLVANVHLDFFQTPRRRQIDLIGMNGVICVEFASWDQATLSLFTRADMAWHHESIPTQRNHMFRDEDADFLHAVFTGAPVSCTIQEALKSLKAVSSIYTPA